MPHGDDATGPTPRSPIEPLLELPVGWSGVAADESDVEALTALLRAHEQHARGWAAATERSVLVEVADPGGTRDNVVVRDHADQVRGWATAHDRAAGRMLLSLTVDHDLADDLADTVAEALLAWGDRAAAAVGRSRGLRTQQVDSGAFAGDRRQQRWLSRGGFERVRTWWQMSRPVTADEARLDAEVQHGVRVRRVRREGSGMPSTDDLRAVHEVLESAFADHFNSHEETFEEFLTRLREDPGHRWDHWWLAELVEGGRAEAAGALVASVSHGAPGSPDGSYVDYLGVLQSARGRGVAKSLLRTIVADAAARGRDRVGLEVDADSPTGAEGLYLSMGWATSYVTESWHRTVSCTPR